MKNNAEDVISQLLGNKNLNLQRGDNSSFDYSRIPFGIPALDKLTGGGIAKNDKINISDFFKSNNELLRIVGVKV